MKIRVHLLSVLVDYFSGLIALDVSDEHCSLHHMLASLVKIRLWKILQQRRKTYEYCLITTEMHAYYWTLFHDYTTNSAKDVWLFGCRRLKKYSDWLDNYSVGCIIMKIGRKGRQYIFIKNIVIINGYLSLTHLKVYICTLHYILTSDKTGT